MSLLEERPNIEFIYIGLSLPLSYSCLSTHHIEYLGVGWGVVASCGRGSGNARASIHPPSSPPSISLNSTLEIEASLCCLASPLLDVGKTIR